MEKIFLINIRFILPSFWFIDTCSLEKEKVMGGQLVQSRVWKQEKATITVITKRIQTIKYLSQHNLGHSDFLEPWVANVWEENGPVVRCKGATKKS